jgi:predicted phage terminase large subunit-like protein
VLSLPAIAETDERIPIGIDRYYNRKASEPLHEAREPLAVLEQTRQELGSDAFAAQYQQRPVPPGGALFKRSWISYYDELPAKVGRAKVIQAWDTAGKEGEENDWSVCTTWLVVNKEYYLIDLIRGRYDYPRLKRAAISAATRFKPDLIMVEDAYTGAALGQELKQLRLGFPVRPVPVTRSKFERAYFHTGKFESGCVRFPRRAAFLAELEAELLSFPHHKNDDQVDSISLALTFEHPRYGMMDVL